MFKPGDEVICVKTPEWRKGEIDPVVGETYTVRETKPCSFDPALQAVLLNEIRNPIKRYIGGLREADFVASHFRKAVKLDISIFREIARNPHKKILEDA